MNALEGVKHTQITFSPAADGTGQAAEVTLVLAKGSHIDLREIYKVDDTLNGRISDVLLRPFLGVPETRPTTRPRTQPTSQPSSRAK